MYIYQAEEGMNLDLLDEDSHTLLAKLANRHCPDAPLPKSVPKAILALDGEAGLVVSNTVSPTDPKA